MRTFEASMQYLARAEKVIPLGSQTFSKSRTQYPYGVSPYFIHKAHGAQVWDIDGNEYIDFVNSLASVNLGYQDPNVTEAVRHQLDTSGVIFSLPHPLETEVAELICEMVPCAEKVRFGKNGSDATAGAIRVARAFTGRDRVAVCGYHGWQDWYIGSTARNRGVPKATQDLTHAFSYNNLDSLKNLFSQHPGEFAAVMMEPMNVAYPDPGFLESVKELTHQHGALLIFDETITGFRYANGGAQKVFSVTPDLSTFGKGLANGYPISAVAGRSDIMKEMEEIFFSFTFGGEALSLAAAKATLQKLKNEPVTSRLLQTGRLLEIGLHEILVNFNLTSVFSLSGHPSWSFLNIKESHGFSAFQIKTLLIQEFFQRGLLCLGTHNISYAHTDQHVQTLLSAYRDILPFIASSLSNGRLLEELRCEALTPLFKIR